MAAQTPAPAGAAAGPRRLWIPAMLRREPPPPHAPRLSGEQYVQLRTLALSAQCAAYAAKMESLQEHRPTAGLEEEKFQREFSEASRRVAEILAETRALCRDSRHLDPQNCSRALAVALNASGRAAHLRGVVARHEADVPEGKAAAEFKKAVAEFEESIHLQPHMPDPYIGVGAALIKLKTAAGLDWLEQAERALRKALELNPTNGKASYYLGKLALRRAVDAQGTAEGEAALAEARRYLDNGDAHPWQQYLLAQVVGKHQVPPDTPLAIRLLDKSILSLRRADARYEWLCELVLGNAAADRRMLLHARDIAAELESCGITPELKARGTAFLAELSARITALKHAPPPAPPVQPVQPAPEPPAEPREQPPVSEQADPAAADPVPSGGEDESGG
ncbi:MAG TPA: hypothetical protein VFQ45_02420 [Longimicrobium sp.]|nr:hypothetical protein [Longimicrobium sp.]